MAIIEFTMTSVFVFYDNVILRQYYVFYSERNNNVIKKYIFFHVH